MKKMLIQLAVSGCFLVLPFMGINYAQDEAVDDESGSFRPCMANSFEEALDQNERLRFRYENAGSEVQAQIRESWEIRKERWDNFTDEQKAAIMAKRQDRNVLCDGSGIGRAGFRGRMGVGRRGR
jgi:hypothetical protein